MFNEPRSMDDVAELMRENLPRGMTPAELGRAFATRGASVAWRMKMSSTSATNATQVIRLRNTTGETQELRLEPLGDRIILAPDVLYELTATNALEEIDFSEEGFTVHGWVTHVTSVAKDGSTQTVWELPG